MKLLNYLTEMARITDNSEYDEEAEKFWKPRSARIWKMIVDGKKYYSSLGETKTYRSDNGQFLIQIIENDTHVFIVGIISKTPNRKIRREEMKDAKWFLELMIQKLKKGKIIVTTPNFKSQRLIKRMEEMAKEKGIKLAIIYSSAISGRAKDMKFKNVEIFVDDKDEIPPEEKEKIKKDYEE